MLFVPPPVKRGMGGKRFTKDFKKQKKTAHHATL
jgi:hypothetical protein